MSKEHVDIGFIIPLREEFERLIATFPRISDGTHGTQYHAILDMGDDKLTGVAFIQNEMGKDAAARATTTLLDLYDVGLIMVLGIAGGLSGDAAIGDVCITGTVFDVLENAKFSDNNGRLLPEFAPIIHHTDELLSFCVKYISLGKDTPGIFDDWRLSQYYAALARIPGEFIGRNNTNEAIAIPDIHVGSIACGAVSKSEDYVSALKKLDRKILAIETESGGVFKVAYTANVPAVTIRGICDYADKNKTRLEQQTNNQARFVAADNVITFVKAQLENQQFIRFVENRRQSTLDGVLFPQGDANSQGLPKILKKIDETIHYHLTQLSPHYQNKPQGYRLPLPRIKRPEERISATPMSRSQEPMGILEAIATNQTILMITPRNYPDSSLPWIIAAEVRRVELNGRQAIPIVLNAESIKPPHGKISDSDVDEIERLDDSSIVFILADFPVLSKSRVTFLKKEIERYPRARFVFVNRSIYKSVGDSPFMVGVPAGLFDVIDIPFAEMSNFFQRSFNLAEQEASVIAWRMKRMFDKFDLIAHPSFFSGVQSEALSSLLKANRRTELLQLAVSGFLSFVVASDESDVVLNRTTREEFLRKLVFEKNVNVRSFDPEQTVAFASEFAEILAR